MQSVRQNIRTQEYIVRSYGKTPEGGIYESVKLDGFNGMQHLQTQVWTQRSSEYAYKNTWTQASENVCWMWSHILKTKPIVNSFKTDT